MFSGFLNNPSWAESFGLKLQFCLKLSVLESLTIRYECYSLRVPRYLTRERRPAADSVLVRLMAEPGSSQSLQKNPRASTLNLKDSVKCLFCVGATIAQPLCCLPIFKGLFYSYLLRRAGVNIGRGFRGEREDGFRLTVM